VTTAIDTVVRERLGIDPVALGPNVLDRAVEGRMLARGLSDPALYTARLMTEQSERDALAADLAVSETWFFRGGRPLFERLAGFLAERAATRTAGGKARAMSIPCSTGEEPYSLAIAMHERFLTPDDFTLDAVDLSDRALSRAAVGRYGSFAFREGGTDTRPAYFRRIGDQWELLPHLRAAVRFLPGNLADPFFLAGERPYDLIVCRNLFIYLTPDAKVRAITNFDRLLALDGRLCVTPAEADRLPPGRFVPDGPTEFGIYRRAGVGSAIHRPLGATEAAASVPVSPGTDAPARSGSLKETARAAPPNTLEAARIFADTGRLDEARAVCEALVRARATDADALALLGVVHLAAGRIDGALDALRKALYLAPDHVEAVSNMMALCARRGDTARAAALRRRLDRLTREEGT
jgi:chemotaxis protein methyltransferase WspC